ncbi:uncharacterized protein H6S33_006205 [Morchella sextelata]|uniref:uncharacterized protein n=1 Tax=Morchella sextelata TaxID=1174677 RepID=UPI001D049561|nr:uncharacterized protein H6S33_006205 [Morchella sextelata]KAH0614319.1 hypothetical protein H6S33_006205 [Morchella sextelata]
MVFVKNLSTFLPLVLSQALMSNAHLSVWMPSMYGLDPTNINSDNASQPLQGYTFEQWWWHGNLDNPPADNESFALPANGSVDVEISSNKAFTTLGRGFKDANPRMAPDPWLNQNGWGNMHAPNRTDVAGSALAIAYKSDAESVLPSDFVVFSVVHDSPARQLETFHVPDLPACPNDRCMCSWFWIHKSIGGTDQMYMVPFVCHVTNATNTTPLGKPVAPINCEGDKSKCVKGAKSPMYWMNLEGNNMFEPGHYAPTYNTGYGYFEGAQTDIWIDGHNATSTASVSANVAAATKVVSTGVRHGGVHRRRGWFGGN